MKCVGLINTKSFRSVFTDKHTGNCTYNEKFTPRPLKP